VLSVAGKSRIQTPRSAIRIRAFVSLMSAIRPRTIVILVGVSRVIATRAGRERVELQECRPPRHGTSTSSFPAAIAGLDLDRCFSRPFCPGSRSLSIRSGIRRRERLLRRLRPRRARNPRRHLGRAPLRDRRARLRGDARARGQGGRPTSSPPPS
jgi:hypothetical protein